MNERKCILNHIDIQPHLHCGWQIATWHLGRGYEIYRTPETMERAASKLANEYENSVVMSWLDGPEGQRFVMNLGLSSLGIIEDQEIQICGNSRPIYDELRRNIVSGKQKFVIGPNSSYWEEVVEKVLPRNRR